MRNAVQTKSSIALLQEALNRSDEECFEEFMDDIAQKMSNKYDLPFDFSLEYVKMQEVQKRIKNDIEWSEHMGPYFWANEIFRLYIGNNVIQD
ncbi:hypothetical protein [Priestia megaterium]